jgi:hypothetical protein
VLRHIFFFKYSSYFCTIILVYYKNITHHFINWLTYVHYYLRNKSWKPECVGRFNTDWRILVFYPEPEARDKIYQYPPIHVKTQNTFWLPWFISILICLKSTNTVAYSDWKTVIYIYVCGKCCTQFMLPMKKSVTFTGACANEIIPNG